MLVDLKVTEFLAELESKAPVPGGGSVAALSGGISSALAGMVANLTIGKKKYVEVQEEMEAISAKTPAYSSRFIELVDIDANSFDDYMKAMKLPKETDEEKALRAEKMEAAIQYAASVPLETAEKSFELFDMIEVVITKGNTNAVTDAAVAAMMARTAILSALYNVKINMGSITDKSFADKLVGRVEELEVLANKREQEILALVKL